MFDLAMRRRMRGAADPPQLNLNSMMDMLSIILVFLLCNISAEEQDFVIANNLTLPESSSEQGFVKAVQVKLTRKELLLEDRHVGKINGGQLATEMDGDKIVELYRQLQRYQARAKDIERGVVLLQADKGFSFDVLNKVMRTCAMAGFPKFRFAIQKK